MLRERSTSNQEDALDAAKQLIAGQFPVLYSLLSKSRQVTIRALQEQLRYPRIEELRIGEISYRFFVTSCKEEGRVTGPYTEKEIIQRILGCLEPGMTMVDVGAATGTHLIPAALKVGPTGQAVAIEPDLHCFQVLVKNLQLNQICHAVPLQVAAWDRDTTLTIHTSGKGGQAPQVTESDGIPDRLKMLKQKGLIPARSLDSLIDNGEIRKPDIVKIDVEGGALRVLNGISGHRPSHFFIEIHPRLGESREEITALLDDRGYVLESEAKRSHEIHCHFVFNNLQP